MEELNIWNRIPTNKVSPIKEAKVLDGNSSYALHFDCRKVHKDALGYLVSNHVIRKALYKEVITKPNIKIITNASITKVKNSDLCASVILANKK